MAFAGGSAVLAVSWLLLFPFSIPLCLFKTCCERLQHSAKVYNSVKVLKPVETRQPALGGEAEAHCHVLHNFTTALSSALLNT